MFICYIESTLLAGSPIPRKNLNIDLTMRLPIVEDRNERRNDRLCPSMHRQRWKITNLARIIAITTLCKIVKIISI